MFNPFLQIDIRHLNVYKQKGVKAFVQQTYDRGRNPHDESQQSAFLLIHFNEINKAREHFEAIKTDPGRRLYFIDVANDWQQLQNLLRPGSHTKIFSILTVPGVHEKARRVLDKKLHYFIDRKTNWRPRSYDLVAFDFKIVFGEIWVVLTYGARHEEIKLDDLEKQGLFT